MYVLYNHPLQYYVLQAHQIAHKESNFQVNTNKRKSFNELKIPENKKIRKNASVIDKEVFPFLCFLKLTF